MPTAANISVREALELLDGPFEEFSRGVADGRYAFWLGSGISRDRVDDLKRIIKRVLDHLQSRVDQADAACRFRRALHEAIDLAQLSATEATGIDIARKVDEWASLDIILGRLTREYAQLLDIRVEGEQVDYLLWDAVDVRRTFATTDAQPDSEHVCLVILAIEGVAPEVASANWDGLIEAAEFQLTDGADAIVQVCVRGQDLREPRRRTRLLKFHGCAVRAAAEPAAYRHLVIARRSQITDWPHNPDFAAIKDELVSLAVTHPTLMIGLSAQDTDIQDIFVAARARMGWPWPSDPPAHMFAENVLGADQRNILRCVYRAAYDANGPAVEASALLRAYAKPLLVSLVLRVLWSKLVTLVRLAEAPGLPSTERANLISGLLHFRNRVAAADDGDRLKFARAIVDFASRALSLFRDGRWPAPGSQAYRPLGAVPVHQMSADPGIQTSGLRELAVAIGVLGWGESQNAWRVNLVAPTDHRGGVVAIGPIGPERSRVYFVANNEAALTLEAEGIVTDSDRDAIVVHSTAPAVRQPRSPRLPPGRTGVAKPRRVDMARLLQDVAGSDELQRRFREEALI